MSYREQLYQNALKAIEFIYKDSKYNKETDFYRIYDIVNATNEAQINSKQWLADNLAPFLHIDIRKIVILGGWYGITSHLLREHTNATINSVDSDPMCKILGNMLKKNTRQNEKLDFITDDALNHFFEEGKSYDLIINTSCEHMDQEDIDLIIGLKHRYALVCFQSNNYHSEPEHINTHNSVEEFAATLDLTRVYWTGTAKPSEDYERYMVIGV